MKIWLGHRAGEAKKTKVIRSLRATSFFHRLLPISSPTLAGRSAVEVHYRVGQRRRRRDGRKMGAESEEQKQAGVRLG